MMTNKHVLSVLIKTKGNCNHITIPCSQCVLSECNQIVTDKEVYQLALKKAVELGYNNIVFDEAL